MPGRPSPGRPAPLTFRSTGPGGAAQAALESADAIGVRWDFYKSLALKVQVDPLKPKDGPGAFLHPTPTFTGPVNVYAVALDFVF